MSQECGSLMSRAPRALRRGAQPCATRLQRYYGLWPLIFCLALESCCGLWLVFLPHALKRSGRARNRGDALAALLRLMAVNFLSHALKRSDGRATVRDALAALLLAVAVIFSSRAGALLPGAAVASPIKLGVNARVAFIMLGGDGLFTRWTASHMNQSALVVRVNEAYGVTAV